MKTRKSILTILLSFFILCLSVFPVLATELETTANSYELKVMHTNDIHSRYDYKENSIIGYSRLKTLKDQEKPDLLIDAGDVFHGQSFATVTKGESIAELMKAVGYDAMAPGNHDFNYGSSRLKELGTIADTKILGGNVLTDGGDPFFEDDFLIKDILLDNGDTIQIGVFGLINPSLYEGISPFYVQGLTFGDNNSIMVTAQNSVDTLKAKGCEVIVAAAHIGDSTNGTLLRSDEIAKNIDGIDVIIDGHTHDVENALVNDTLIVQTGYYFNNIGLVDLTLEKQPDATYALTEKNSRLISAKDATGIPSNPEIDTLIEKIIEAEAPILDKVVGNSPVDLDYSWEKVRIQELNLGRVTTDAYRFVTDSDIAIENAGGLRASIAAGEITKGDVINVLPFGNYLLTKEILGSDILNMLEANIETEIKNNIANDSGDYDAWPSNSGSYIQWSGLKASYDVTKPFGERIDLNSVTIGDSKLDLSKSYKVSGSNYVLTSDDYPALKAAPVLKEYQACDEAFINYLESAGTERFLNAVNTPNVTKAKIIDPVPPNPDPIIPNPDPIIPNPSPVTPTQPETPKKVNTSASPTNPKTGYQPTSFIPQLLLNIQ